MRLNESWQAGASLAGGENGALAGQAVVEFQWGGSSDTEKRKY